MDKSDRHPDPHVVLCICPVQEHANGPVSGVTTEIRGPFFDKEEAEAYAKQENEGTPEAYVFTAVRLYGGVVR